MSKKLISLFYYKNSSRCAYAVSVSVSAFYIDKFF